MTHTTERSDSADSPLETVAGAAGPRAIEAFSVLGNETRLAILLALWETYEPWAGENAVPFTELRNRVGLRQGGQFTYHLEKLVGYFVRKTDAGYELQRAGHQLVRSVIAGAGLEVPALDPTEVDWDCPVCGAPTMVTSHDEGLFHVCTECDGRFGNRGHFPEGTLASTHLDPAGFTDRGPEELLNAAFIAAAWATQSAIEGVCDACFGPMDGWLDLCDDHAAEGVCPNCERRYAVMARFRCLVCKNHHAMVPSCSWIALRHPSVVTFYYDRGVPIQYVSDGEGSFLPRYRDINSGKDIDYELIAEDPPLVRVVYRYEGDELRLTLDEELNVVDVSGPY